MQHPRGLRSCLIACYFYFDITQASAGIRRRLLRGPFVSHVTRGSIWLLHVIVVPVSAIDRGRDGLTATISNTHHVYQLLSSLLGDAVKQMDCPPRTRIAVGHPTGAHFDTAASSLGIRWGSTYPSQGHMCTSTTPTSADQHVRMPTRHINIVGPELLSCRRRQTFSPRSPNRCMCSKIASGGPDHRG